MNKEIKEINLPKEIEEAFNCIDYELSVCSDELPKILDYITNLQQELQIMIKDDERSQETIIRLTKENERLKEWKEDLLKENIELVNIRKEAIEYITQYREIYYPDEPLSEPKVLYHLGIYEDEFDEEKLLNILQNGSEEK